MSKFRIILVSIHAEDGPEAIPLGAACVASALKAGADGARLDVSLAEAFATENPQAIAARIVAAKPDLVGFSLYSWNRSLSIAVARRLRSLLGETVLFAGGPDATAQPDGLPGDFDFAIAGEGEIAAVEAVGALLSGEFASVRGVVTDGIVGGSAAGGGADSAAGGGAGAKAELPDAGTLPSPWLDGTLVPAGRKGVLWELARGCPYSCAYCYESKGEHRVRYLDEARLLSELDLFVEAGVPSVFVLDPTFNANKERARRLLDLIESKPSDIHWHFEVRAESLDRGLARRFASLGASLQIGLQSSDPGICARIGRKLDRGLFASRIALLNEEGAVFGLDLIFGLPDDDLAGYRASLDFALSLYPNNLDLFRLSVLPGTELADRASEFGLFAETEAPYRLLSAPGFPERDLAAAERLSDAANLFYNKGRAVAWFNQILHPLGVKPAVFLEGFADYLDRLSSRRLDPKDPVALERLQLEYLDRRYEAAGLEFIQPAVWDVVRFHGAWGRAIAEGIATDIAFNYDPDDVVGEGAMDLDEFASLARMKACRVRVEPTDGGEPNVRVFDA